MISFTSLLLVSTLALELAGPPSDKVDRPSTGGGFERPAEEERSETEEPLAPAGGATAGLCSSWRLVGVKEDSAVDEPCPPLAGWRERHLFAPRPPAQDCLRDRRTDRVDVETSDLPPGLRPFCVYERAEPTTPVAEEIPGLASVARDCVVVRPAASRLVSRFGDRLEDRFLAQAGQPDRQAGAGKGPGKVRLAIVDTAPTDEVSPETAEEWNSPHGYTLANLADALLCRPFPGSCRTRVTARLALAYVTYNPFSAAGSIRDEVRGGFVGSVEELAEAIRDETVAWLDAGTEHLILNLSVGWNPAYTAADHPASRAVRAAIEDAGCRGAVIVAAAGNREWGPDPAFHLGALLPAAWESLPAPSRTECEAKIDPSDVEVDDDASYRPLLYSAGAVDVGGRPIADQRVGAEPRLTAFGDHAVVSTHRPGEPTAVLTGTSVGALVVSAAAALAWSDDPRRDAARLMERIWRRGGDLDRAAGTCLAAGPGQQPDCAGPATRVHRVSVCAAAGRACRTEGAGAAAPGGSPGSPDDRRLVVDFGGLVATLAGEAVARVAWPGVGQPAPGSACPPASLAGLTGDPQELFRGAVGGDDTDRCPHYRLPGVRAMLGTGPQPESNPCNECGFGSASPGTLVVEIDPDFRGRLSHATLIVGTNSYRLPLPAGRDQPPRLIVENVPAEPGDTVLLSFVVDGVRSALSPILHLRRE